MKVYIAGSITNDPDYLEKFEEAEHYLKSLGATVLNPIKPLGFEYDEYIDMGLAELSKCEAIYLLKGFEESKGAMLELMYASATGKKIFMQENKDINLTINILQGDPE